MGELARRAGMGRRDPPRGHALNADERRALAKLRAEAKEKGATLETDGEGGLPPSLVLGVMRRDGWRCKTCGTRERLSIHHKGGVVASKRLARLGHKSVPENLVTICPDCHDRVHDKARAAGVDSSQVEPEGDR